MEILSRADSKEEGGMGKAKSFWLRTLLVVFKWHYSNCGSERVSCKYASTCLFAFPFFCTESCGCHFFPYQGLSTWSQRPFELGCVRSFLFFTSFSSSLNSSLFFSLSAVPSARFFGGLGHVHTFLSFTGFTFRSALDTSVFLTFSSSFCRLLYLFVLSLSLAPSCVVVFG